MVWFWDVWMGGGLVFRLVKSVSCNKLEGGIIKKVVCYI